MRNITGRIVSALNESVDDQFMDHERTVGVTLPKQVHQCTNCAEFYLVDEVTNESVCPECGGEGKPAGDITECGADPVYRSELIDEDEEEDLRSEAELVVSEALSSLDHNDYKKFNECYRPRVRITSKGELQALVESSKGGCVTASRRMTSRQKTAYSLSERYVGGRRTSRSSKRNESVKISRQNLLIKNESRALKIQACRLLERQGAQYNFRKFNEGMDKFISTRNVRRMLEDISQDDEIGTSELETMSPSEIGDAVTSVVKDTGLSVITNDVDIDDDTATVNVRVEDTGDQEVHTSELEDTLGEVFDAPVEIVGPYESEGDNTVSDLAVVINPDESLDEDDIPTMDKIGEDLTSEDDNLDEDDDLDSPKLPEVSKKFEGYRGRSHRKRRGLKEAFKQGSGETPLYALMVKGSDDAPQFLAQDDSLIDGSESNAEDQARLFVSEEAASAFLTNVGLDDEFVPKSISVIMNESDTPDIKSEKEITEDSNSAIDTDDGTFYKKDGTFYKESTDGTTSEIDESEYEDAKATYDAEQLKESYLRRRSNRKSSSRRRK